MEITDEQRERIQKNRERALQKQKERKQKLLQNEKEKETLEKEDEKRKLKDKESSSSSKNKKQKVEATKGGVELEEFEEGASEWISKAEAMKLYCVPQGTLAVCEVEERPNPHNAKWKPMKLYRRSEVRERSRKRWGGLQGLIAERKKREEKQLKKDMEVAASIFK